MSAPDLHVEFTVDAQADLTSIAFYTAERWGTRQRDAYIERIVTATHDLPQFPGRGRIREDLGEAVRALPVEQHVIYYRATDQAVTILRVLHSRMDARLLIEE